MATKYYSAQTDGVLDASGSLTLGDAAFLGGKVHALTGTLDMAANTVASGDTIVWGELPKGAVPLYGLLATTASLGTATIDVGSDATAAKFRAAATFTATDTPTAFGKAAAIGVALTAKTRIQSVVATDDLPSSGTLALILFYTTPHSG